MDVLCGMGGLPQNSPIALSPYKNVRYVSFLVTVIQHNDDVLEICNMARLRERRENLCLSFMEKKTLSNTDQLTFFPHPRQ